MTYTLATREYRKGLSTFYDDWFKSVPNHMRVTRVVKIRERVFEWHAQELHDYLICFADGTCDPRSFSPIQELPAVGSQFNRLTAGAGDFATWTPSDEELDRIA